MNDTTERDGQASHVAQLTQQLRARDEFLSVLTHELRTPLTPMTTAMALLHDDARFNQDLLPALRMVQRNMDALVRMVDDLDDAWRLRESKLNLMRTDVDVHQLINSMAPRWLHDAEVRGLTLTLALTAKNATVRGDASRLNQLLLGLLTNALKFTPDGRSVKVTTSNPVRGTLLLEVVDTGIGIEPPLLPRVFDGWSLPTPSGLRRYGGLGLGLPIARELARLHDGDLSITSLGRDLGCTAKLTLPAVTPGTAEAALAPESQKKLSILLVDDHEDTLILTKIMLERRGYVVATATTMEVALQLGRAHTYDLVVSDIVLPDGSGLELFATLKSETGVVGIALSGFGREADIHRSKEAGFSEHLTKPVNMARLHEVIQHLF